ncbi:MAG: fructose-bisphosphatase class II [Chloroflexi bacterium UTCFX4]|nr:MAG: fructose-bisphosphatase class II [Chloroflexi bacterium UTCFX4]
MSIAPDRNIGLELVRVTESAALAAAPWMGRNRKNDADKAAVDAMRLMLNTIEMDGVIVIGEGEKDKAPMLFNGERIGNYNSGRAVPKCDLAVDPIDGTRPLALGLPNALAVVALAERGSMFFPGPIVYMDKLAVGPDAAGVIDLNAPVAENLNAIARVKGKSVTELVVVVLDRPRHEQLIAEIRATGSRLKLITDGDVAPSIAACLPDTGVDVVMGAGGAPEAVVTAGALKCLRGEIQARLYPRDEKEKQHAESLGYDTNKVFTSAELVKSDNVFFAATGITGGELLRGVQYFSGGATTESLAMRSASGTMRRIQAVHRSEKLAQILHEQRERLAERERQG